MKNVMIIGFSCVFALLIVWVSFHPRPERPEELGWHRGLRAAQIPLDEYGKCMEWALGENWGTLEIREVPEIFDKRHDLGFWRLSNRDSVSYAFYKIGKAYTSEANPNYGSENWIENQEGSLGENVVNQRN